ncbi:MAG: outer membrane beta-barrel protein [Pseudobdellovibrionaceae bacterium]
MKKFLAVFAVMMGFASASHANILIEPYLGYEMGKTKDYSAGTATGSQMGLRLGYALPIFFWAALDATTGTVSLKPDSGSAQDAKRTTVSGVVGFDFPILVRAWAGYSLMDELNASTSGKYKGSATKLGVAFTGLPFISLNFEYVTESFNELAGTALSTNLKNDSYIVSVSLPFKF